MPEQVSFTAGALIEPLACCIRGLKNAGTGFNDVVLIVGAGPIGLMHMQLAKIAGAKQVIVSEPNPMRRQIALELGADKAVDPVTEDLAGIISDVTGGLGADVIVMAIGVPGVGELYAEAVQEGRNSESVCWFCRNWRVYDRG